jgi:hypothetical protein
MDDPVRCDEQAPDLKQQLPYPYGEDLAGVLRAINRREAGSRDRQANDPVTAAYLKAATTLVQDHLGPGVRRGRGGAGLLLGFLSQRAVAAQVRHNPPPFHRIGRVSTLRDRWMRHSDFIADVLRFGLWAQHYPAAHQDMAAEAAGEAMHGQDPVDGIHRLCYWDLTWMLGTPMFRLGLIATAAAEANPVVAAAISDRDRASRPLWKECYETFLTARGLQLRPGITLDDCVTLLTAVSEGLAMRSLVSPQSGLIDHDRRRCLLGTAVLAIIAGCTTAAGDDDHTSLEDAVRAMTVQSPAEPES